jgi:flavin reductase (DIM6/NTAB) family NADH-FMN oxidoreductase RutF
VVNAAAAERPLDARALRGCLGQFATGVAVVTYQGDDGPRGATINSFTSVSMDPPLVLVSFARHTTAARMLSDRPFVVNVLASNQLDIALQFAGRPQTGLDVPWSPTAEVPRLRGTVAWLQCTPWANHDGGDHLLFPGQVVHSLATTAGQDEDAPQHNSFGTQESIAAPEEQQIDHSEAT